ncbi:MAG: hypothetical protein HKP08_08420, partial [Flavobacteriaceae bacterium]|nr:hypothetical protein [Flavobacteriaceae bacterium]
VKDEKLFVCDGSFGLKVYDKTNVPEITPLEHFEGMTTFDVIPMADQLLMIGDGILYQYAYTETSLELISTMALD